MSQHVATSTDPLFQVTQVFYLLGFIALMVFLFATSRWLEEKGGKFGVFATLAALVGTMALGGDLWFETFAVPWIADEVPGAFDTDPTVVLALGAISSYLLMAIGWALFGIASFRARDLPAGPVRGAGDRWPPGLQRPPGAVRHRPRAGRRCGRHLGGPQHVACGSRGR